MLLRMTIVLWLAATSLVAQGYDYWADSSVVDKFTNRLKQGGYASLDTWNLIWILHEERDDLSVAASYLLAQPGNDKDLARNELNLEITRWRSRYVAIHTAGALATLGSCDWADLAMGHLDEGDPVEQMALARAMARCKDYRAWPWVRRQLLSKSSSDVVFGEALATSYQFEMMDIGKGRRFSMAAELVEFMDEASPERRAQLQMALDKVQGDTWTGKPNYDRLPTLPKKQ